MKNSLRFTSVLCALMSLVATGACPQDQVAAEPQGVSVERPVPADKALVYVYKKGGIVGAANAWRLFANNNYVTRITNSGYYDFLIDPGHVDFGILGDNHFIGVGDTLIKNAILHSKPDQIAHLDAASGQTYFFKFEIGNFSGNRLREVPKDEALKTMMGMHRFRGPELSN